MTASAAGSGGAVCPSTAAGGAVIFLCTAAPAAGSGVFCARRLLQLGQSLLVLRLRCLLELVVRLLPLWCMVCRACLVYLACLVLPGVPGAPGVPSMPGVPGPMHCQWWVRLAGRGSGGGSLRLWLLLVGREVLPVFLGSRFWTRCFFHPLLVAPSLEAPQRGSSCRFG